MKKNNNICVSGGDFKIGCTIQAEKFRSDGTITYKGPKFHNLVLNCGLDALIDYPIWYNKYHSMLRYCNVGTGNSVPNVSQTGLDNYLASTNNFFTEGGVNYSLTAPVYVSHHQVHEFPIGSCAGNLTEVGFSADPDLTYFNRQLFKDQFDNPTTITVLSDEGLRVSSEIFVYFNMEPGVSLSASFNLDGSPVDYVKDFNPEKLSNINCSQHNILGCKIGEPLMRMIDTNNFDDFSDGDSNYSEITYNTYVNGSFERTGTFVWNPGWTDIGCFFVSCNNYTDYNRKWLTRYNLKNILTYPNTTKLTISAKVSWGRI